MAAQYNRGEYSKLKSWLNTGLKESCVLRRYRRGQLPDTSSMFASLARPPAPAKHIAHQFLSNYSRINERDYAVANPIW